MNLNPSNRGVKFSRSVAVKFLDAPFLVPWLEEVGGNETLWIPGEEDDESATVEAASKVATRCVDPFIFR